MPGGKASGHRLRPRWPGALWDTPFVFQLSLVNIHSPQTHMHTSPGEHGKQGDGWPVIPPLETSLAIVVAAHSLQALGQQPCPGVVGFQPLCIKPTHRRELGRERQDSSRNTSERGPMAPDTTPNLVYPGCQTKALTPHGHSGLTWAITPAGHRCWHWGSDFGSDFGAVLSTLDSAAASAGRTAGRCRKGVPGLSWWPRGTLLATS